MVLGEKHGTNYLPYTLLLPSNILLKLKDPTWSASLRGVLGSVNYYYIHFKEKINR